MTRKSASKRAGPSERPWYEQAFTHQYLRQYAHRSDNAARAELQFITRLMKLRRGARVLDLCCGAGRHSQVLAEKGYRVVGLDLSADLLKEARKRRDRRLAFVRGDMRRLPFANASFDGLVNLFTSFGYFMKDSDNQQVLNEVARVLKPGSPFVMDFLNITFVRKTLVPCSERCEQDMELREERWYDRESKRLNKLSRLKCGKEECVRRESVRAYTRVELLAMCRRAGLKPSRVFGDLAGSSFKIQSSPRCVILARRSRGGAR